jgi:hypothetical protein
MFLHLQQREEEEGQKLDVLCAGQKQELYVRMLLRKTFIAFVWKQKVQFF